MNKNEAWNKLKLMHQTSLLTHWEILSPLEKEGLLRQIDGLDVTLFQKQQSLIFSHEKAPTVSIQPFTHYSLPSEEDAERGRQLLAQGKVGSLLIAGGQGSRLKFEGPKGMFPVSVVQKKSLFQLYAEKILAASHQSNQVIPVAIMTSLFNHKETQHYFETHNYFGLDPTNVSFFSQGFLPLLTFEGNLFLEEPGKIAEGPDGNGSVFECFIKNGLHQKWRDSGVEYVNVVLIDNPLADPVDAQLIGNHFQHQSNVTIKCIARKDEKEKVGVLVEQEAKVAVIEYSEFSEEEKAARDEKGTLKHLCANISLFCFDLSFMEEVATTLAFPMHLACKSVKYLNGQGKSQLAEKNNAWKFEKFIFDALSFAKKTRALLYPREETFAPLKNFEGEDSLFTVQELLQKRDQEIFRQITGHRVEDRQFELSQDFYYPTEALKEKWKGKTLPETPYILS